MLPLPAFDPEAFARAEHAIARRARQLTAPRAGIEALRAAAALPFGDGLARERELHLELCRSPQAAALRHAWLAERAAAEVPGLAADTPVREIALAAVVGAGTMGGGIAMCFADAGMPVTLLDAQPEALARGMDAIRRNYAASVARGTLTQALVDERLARIRPTLDWQALAAADLIVEAVFEDIGVKEQVFRRIDRVARDGAILATNTSYLDVAAIAEFTGRPQDVLGMHFFSPANVMRLLENVRAPKSAPEVLASAMQVGRRLGKVAVLVGGADGFVGNRMLAQRTREAWFLLEEGALPQQVDRALTDFGFAMGPFAVGDLAGLDIGWRARRARAHLRPPGVRDCDLLDKVCHAGRLGQKSGAGWYRYRSEVGAGRTPIPDAEIEQLIVAHSRERGIERRAIEDREIVERCLYAMVNEAAKILAEGVAARALDIDLVWLHGYGFPRWRGGPLFWADQVGPGEVHRAILGYRERFGAAFWTPAPLLEELAIAGRGFHAPAAAA
jgi:3-hydroxyacyl-CoA dehydrogenase